MAAAGLNEDGRKRKVVVTGCLAQRYSHELAKDLPEADLVRVWAGVGKCGGSGRWQGLCAASRALLVGCLWDTCGNNNGWVLFVLTMAWNNKSLIVIISAQHHCCTTAVVVY